MPKVPAILRILTISFLGQVLAAENTPNPLSIDDLLFLSRDAADSGLWDYANFYLISANEKGMSEDSLRYFMAEVYLRQNSFEKALEYNIVIMDTVNLPVKSQQDRIFNKMDEMLKPEEESFKDTLRALNGSTTWRPYIELSLGAGYSRNDNLNNNSINWYPGSRQNFNTAEKGLRRELMLRAFWDIPVINDVSLSPGLTGGVNKNYYNDNLTLDLNAHLNIDGILNLFSLSYHWDFDKELEFDSEINHQLAAGLNYPHGKLAFEANTSYHFNRPSQFEEPYRYFAADAGLTRQVLQGELIFSLDYAFSKASASQDEELYVQYVDDVTKSAPVHFTDNTFLAPIPRNFDRNMKYREHDESLFSQYAFGYWVVNPAFTVGIPLTSWLQSRITVRSGMKTYTRRNNWFQIIAADDSTQSQIDHGSYLVLNQTDYQYYLFDDNSLISSYSQPDPEKFSEKPVQVIFRDVVRKDKSLALNITLTADFNNLGYWTFWAGVKHIWTNIQDMLTTYRIPKWESRVFLTYTKPFTFSSR